MIIPIMISLLVGAAGLGVSVYYSQSNKKLQAKLKEKKEIRLTEEDAIAKASDKARNILLKSKNEALEEKSKAEKKVKELYDELDDREKRIDQRERKISQRESAVDKEHDEIERQKNSLEQAKRDVKGLRSKLTTSLEKIAEMDKETAQKKLLTEVEEELKDDIAKKVKVAEIEAQRTADEKAKWVLVDAMQKSATDYVAETTTTTIDLENEELKGKIIGKEGRNIRTFEKLTGVDIIVDESPEAVTLSCFDPVRREVASLALQKLLKDGRVHPGTVEETIMKVKKDIAREIKATGEKMSFDAGFPNLPIEIIRLLGRFKYRYSYGQNLIKHTLEMIKLGAELATELNADVNLVKKACLLHDIGKVMVHEVEGKPHHVISGEIIRKYLRDEKLANAAEAHHGDIEAKSIEAIVVAIADAISGARPGARRDNYEEYVKRIRALEDIANKHKEVKETYAIHAGREIRVILKPEESSDKDAEVLARDISKEIEKTQQYPGTVKVTVIREFRVQGNAG
ncbi:MAG: ribonuclease Y [Candidatus Dojkabacteria bacterium]|nr:ribonuclease Y [Candidatus Dojkabacteria bacterium]